MDRSGPLETAAWAAAGAALLGGGVFLGVLTAGLGRRREVSPPAGVPVAPDPALSRRVEELAAAVDQLHQRVEAVAAPAEKIDTITERVGQLEKRVEQIVASASPAPPLEQVLAAVEQMVTAKVGGLDDRLSDQVHAIEMLRQASRETDAWLERLTQAVEHLSEQSAGLNSTLNGSPSQSR